MNPASDTVLTSPKPHQVAIVDSDASITNLIKLNLEDEGYGVCTFANAEDALDAGFAHTDLVITEGHIKRHQRSHAYGDNQIER